MPRKTLFKIGLATAAAAVAAILAITSALAHGTPTTTGRSMVGTIVNAATGASLVSFQDPASNALTDEQTSDAIEAAELAAKIAAEQAKLAAQQAEEAAEAAAAAAANTCGAADQTEDVTEQGTDPSEDSAEKTNGSESALEDSNEKAAAQAAEKTEAPEVKCAGSEGDHKSGDNHESSTKTFSKEGDH